MLFQVMATVPMIYPAIPKVEDAMSEWAGGGEDGTRPRCALSASCHVLRRAAAPCAGIVRPLHDCGPTPHGAASHGLTRPQAQPKHRGGVCGLPTCCGALRWGVV